MSSGYTNRFQKALKFSIHVLHAIEFFGGISCDQNRVSEEQTWALLESLKQQKRQFVDLYDFLTLIFSSALCWKF